MQARGQGEVPAYSGKMADPRCDSSSSSMVKPLQFTCKIEDIAALTLGLPDNWAGDIPGRDKCQERVQKFPSSLVSHHSLLTLRSGTRCRSF